MNEHQQADPGPGRRLGVDVGAVRVGIALSDPAPMLATPLETLRRDEEGGSDLAKIADLVSEHDVVEIVIGLPKTLAGRHGSAAEIAQAYGEALVEKVAPVPVRFHDERLTTVTASRKLSKRGVRGKKQRAVVDQAAAVEILQAYLDGRGTKTREELP